VSGLHIKQLLFIVIFIGTVVDSSNCSRTGGSSTVVHCIPIPFNSSANQPWRHKLGYRRLITLLTFFRFSPLVMARLLDENRPRSPLKRAVVSDHTHISLSSRSPGTMRCCAQLCYNYLDVVWFTLLLLLRWWQMRTGDGYNPAGDGDQGLRPPGATSTD
jgi:hypothetical protein